MGVGLLCPNNWEGASIKTIDSKTILDDSDDREPLEVSAAATDRDDVMARLRDRFGVGDY